MHPLLSLIVALAPAPDGEATVAVEAPPRQAEIPAVDTPEPTGEAAKSAEAPAPSPTAEAPAPEPAPAAEAEVYEAREAPELGPNVMVLQVADDQREVGEKKEKKKKKKVVDIDWKGRVVGGYRLRIKSPSEAQNDEASTKHAMQLRQARVNLYGRYKDVLNIKVSGDFADFLDNPGPGMVLRDAWANVRVHDLFQIKVGEFKRPYSALELRGVSKLHLVSRGLFNSAAIEDLSWGERATGAMVWGKLKAKKPGLHRIEWALSVTNDAIAGAQDGIDVHGRVAYAPHKMITLGVTGAYKRVEDFTGNDRDTFGGDVDLTFKYEGLRVGLEADLAQDWTYQEADGTIVSPNMMGLIGFASYKFELPKELALQPAFTYEYVDTNMLYTESEAMRMVGNLNLMWTEHLVLRPQVEFVRPVEPVTALNQFVQSQTYGLWLQVQI